MSCELVRDRLSELSLGLLTPEDARDLERHLESCPGCRKEWAELQESVASVALSLPPAEPPEELEDRVVDRVMASAGTIRRPSRRRGARVLAVVALTAAVVAGGALQWGLTQRYRAETTRQRMARILDKQNDLTKLIELLRTEFRGTGTLYQATLYPGTRPEAAGTVLIYSAPKGVGFVLVHVEAPVDEKLAPYSVNLVSSTGRRLGAGSLERTNNGDHVLYREDIPHDLSRSDSLELSQVTSLSVVDRFGRPVMTGLVHQFVEAPPSP